MANLVLKDPQGNPHTYAGYDQVVFNTADGDTVIFSEGESVENKFIDINLADGDQVVEADNGTLMKRAIIKKPATLAPANIAKDVTIAGVTGTFGVDGVENVEIIPDFSDGNYSAAAEEGTLMKSVIIKKPDTLIPENIVESINIAGVIGTHRGGGSGGGSVVEPTRDNRIKFYDYDGTLIDSWQLADLDSKTELPAYPVHPGLTCQGWNWTLDQLRAENAPADVGAMYITDDGKTRIYITLTDGRTSPWLGLGVNGSVDVDWGDETPHDTLTGTSTSSTVSVGHTYANPGDYMITLTINGEALIIGSSKKSSLLTDSTGTHYNNYLGAIKMVCLGENIDISGYAFLFCKNLSSVTIPSGVTSIGMYAFNGCYTLSSITIPSGVTSIGDYAFSYCYGLSSISVPSGLTSMSAYAFSSCYALSSIAIPSSVTSMGDYVFSYCYGLLSVTIPSGVTSINGLRSVG